MIGDVSREKGSEAQRRHEWLRCLKIMPNSRLEKRVWPMTGETLTDHSPTGVLQHVAQTLTPRLRMISRSLESRSTEERLKIAMQHGFQFLHEQPALSLLCLQDQQEDRFEELDTHRGAQAALPRRKVWGTSLKAEFKAGLQFLRQSMSQTRHTRRDRGI